MKKIINVCLTITLAIMVSSCNSKKAENINHNASVTVLGDLPENPLLLNAMTTSVNRKAGLISTIFGNNTAVKYALKQAGNEYGPGTLLYKVTWQSKPDSLWYGANIPGNIKKVERLEFYQNTPPFYTEYEGNTLKKVMTSNKQEQVAIENLIAEKMAVAP